MASTRSRDLNFHSRVFISYSRIVFIGESCVRTHNACQMSMQTYVHAKSIRATFHSIDVHLVRRIHIDTYVYVYTYIIYTVAYRIRKIETALLRIAIMSLSIRTRQIVRIAAENLIRRLRAKILRRKIPTHGVSRESNQVMGLLIN